MALLLDGIVALGDALVLAPVAMAPYSVEADTVEPVGSSAVAAAWVQNV